MAPGLVYDNKSKSKPPQGALQAVQTSDIIIQSLQIPNQILHVKLGLQMQIPCLPFFLLFITFIPTFPASFGQKDVNLFQNCSSSLRCGESFPEIRFPFWGGNRSPECGMEGFYVTCLHDGLLTIDISGHTFRVHSINSTSYALTIAPDALWNGGCPEFYTDISPFFPAGQETTDLPLFYNCSYRINDDPKYRFSCSNTRDNNPRVYSFRNDSDCKENISVRALRSEVDKLNRGNASATLEDVLYKGFSVEYSLNWTACLGCMFSKGLCWAGTISAERTCLCSDGSRNLSDCPPAKKDKNIPLKIGIGFGASLGTALVAALLFFVYKRRQTKRSNSSSTLLSGDYSSYSSSALDPEKCMSNFGVHIFDYYELEEATSNFNSERELGDGGFGTVYKGKLKDGRDVAVKRLYENNFKRVDHFKNEVVILTRLRHKNLVTLYGCTSRHSRELLLVYEYVPNGTVADHLHGALAKPGSLPWSTRMKIAVETASALCYLHASDVIHRDVKTNNILLDSNFSVKVADFGLSRLFPMHMTHISTAPQGTPGYVDPEYHQCYQLTDRSDVFSFGVVLIELITSMPAVDITRHRHEINLSNLAINKIQSKTLHEIVDPNLGFETDENVRLMILDVAELAFQSLQQGRDMRPSMQEVLETLKHIQSKDANSGDASELDNQADEAKLLKSRTVTCSPDSVIEGWASSTTTPSISN